jgi:hypothetical protein
VGRRLEWVHRIERIEMNAGVAQLAGAAAVPR